MECQLHIKEQTTPTLPSPWSGRGFTEQMGRTSTEHLQSLPLTRGRLRGGGLLLLVVLLGGSGCARVKEVNFTDLAGNECRTTKVHPDVISAETFTACIKDGKPETIPTQHTDMSMFAGAAAILAAAISVTTF